MLTERFDSALLFASRLHRHQTRKGGDVPYMSHLLGVASLVLEAHAWKERKQAYIDRFATADESVRRVACADKSEQRQVNPGRLPGARGAPAGALPRQEPGR